MTKAWILLSMPLMACVHYSLPGAFAPARGSIPVAERTLAWQHAVTALLDNGYVPNELNETAGYIVARRRDDDTGPLVGSLATVVLTPEGMVRVEVSGTGVFTSEKTFVSTITARQNDILQSILATHAAARALPLPSPKVGEPVR